MLQVNKARRILTHGDKDTVSAIWETAFVTEDAQVNHGSQCGRQKSVR